MEKIYWFIYDNLADEWEAIMEVKENATLGVKLLPEEEDDPNDYYTSTPLKESQARQFFTLTGHLPSEKFEQLMTEIKENDN